MKVQFDLPTNGYAAEITQARLDGDFDGWIDRKFAARIRELISDDFTITAGENSFTVDFVYEDDAFAFLNTFGGREIAE